MIKREIETELMTLLDEYPVVTILGPRQSGKTTLAKSVLNTFAYSNLEDPVSRDFAKEDPIAYLSQFSGPVIIDEVQRVPELLSYIQVIVDEEKTQGRFVLTGSHQLKLQEAVTQSLAGRTAILNLLPLSIAELKAAGICFDTFEEYCFRGFFPRIYDRKMRPSTFYSNYYRTYVERDVRQLINIKNLSEFEKFLKLLAGRVGQIIDYSGLANDTGAAVKTIKNWLSVLEASFIIYKLSPYFENFGKRVIKSPKYYFTDVGLLCFLLGIEKKEQIGRDPLRGNIFENLVLLECLKSRLNQGRLANLHFFRDSHGNEVDILFSQGRALVPIEIKSSKTFNSKFKKGIMKFQKLTDKAVKGFIIYTGDFTPRTEHYSVVNFKHCHSIFNGKEHQNESDSI